MMTYPGPVAVTGATGFLGQHIISDLLAANIPVIAILREASDADAHGLPAAVTARTADITDAEALARSFHGARAVIHAAGFVSTHGSDARRLYAVNVDGARNVIAAAQQVGAERILFTSSTSAVGALNTDRPDLALDEAASFNLSNLAVPYVQAKRAAHEAAVAQRRQGAPIVILSPSFVLGPDDWRRNTAILIDSVRRRALPGLPSGGLNPIDVRDLAAAYMAALGHPDPAPHYILAGRENISLPRLVSRIAACAGVSPPRLRLPRSVALTAAWLAERVNPAGPLTAAGARLGAFYWYFNAALARRDLGLETRPLEDTITATLAWLAKEDATEDGRIQHV